MSLTSGVYGNCTSLHLLWCHEQDLFYEPGKTKNTSEKLNHYMESISQTEENANTVVTNVFQKTKDLHHVSQVVS